MPHYKLIVHFLRPIVMNIGRVQTQKEMLVSVSPTKTIVTFK